MFLRVFLVFAGLWLPYTTGQGCPYSRTVVPGDAKRYIEIVHNVPHERHCAPGTEFDPLSCECSLLSGIPWSAGSAFISGLKSAYPELANVPLDTIQQELLQITSQNANPYMHTGPSMFESTNLGFHTNTGFSAIDPFSSVFPGNNPTNFDLIRPEELSPDIINALDRILLLENNPTGSNTFSLQSNPFSPNVNIHSRNNDQAMLADSILANMLDANSRTGTKNFNARNSALNPSHFLVPDGDESLFLRINKHKPVSAPNVQSGQTVNIQEISQLIESFQKLMSAPNTNSPTPVQSPPTQKQSALDNFHTIADSILKAFPATNKPSFTPNVLPQHVAHHHLPQRNRSWRRTPLTETSHHKPNNLPQNRLLPTTAPPQIPKPVMPDNSRNNLPNTNKQNQWQQPNIHPPLNSSPPRQLNPQSFTDRHSINQFHTNHHPQPNTKDEQINKQNQVIQQGTMSNIPKQIHLETSTSLGQQDSFLVDNNIEINIPSTWKYFGSVNAETGSAPVNRNITVNVSSFKIPTNWRKFQNPAEKHSRTKTTQPELFNQMTTRTHAQNKEQINLENRTTLKPHTSASLQPEDEENNDNITADLQSKPTDDMPATKLLKLIKKQLKQAKKTGNIPFSLLKMLLEKRNTLMSKLKEEQAMKQAQLKEKPNNKEETTIEKQAQLKEKTNNKEKTTVEKQAQLKEKTNNKAETTIENQAQLKEKTNNKAETTVENQIHKLTTTKLQAPTVSSTLVKTTKPTTTTMSTTTATTTQPKTTTVSTTTPTTTQATMVPTTTGTTIQQIIPTDKSIITSFQPNPIKTDQETIIKNEIEETKYNTLNYTNMGESTKINTISSFSAGDPALLGIGSRTAGDPTVSLLGITSRLPTSKPRKSTPAEFRYDPTGAGLLGLNNQDLVSLLSYKSALELFSGQANIGKKPLEQAHGLGLLSPTPVPQLDLFAESSIRNAHSPDFSRVPEVRNTHAVDLRNIDIPEVRNTQSPDLRNSHVSEPKLTSPLLSQDLATITAFLKERREQRKLQALENSKPSINGGSFRAGGLTSHRAFTDNPQTEIPPTVSPEIKSRTQIRENINNDRIGGIPVGTNIHDRLGGIPVGTDNHNDRIAGIPVGTSQARENVQLPNRAPDNIPNTNSQTTGGSSLDARKNAILEKLMAKLSSLQAQTSNSGQSQSISEHAGQNGKSSTHLNIQQGNSRPHNVQLLQSFNTQKSPHMPMPSQQSAYSMMFNSIAAKEGASDAQEIMQDKITEMGGNAALLGMDPTMLAGNSEIRSQLSSTLLENHPLAFLM